MRLAAAHRWPAFENARRERPLDCTVEVGVVADDERVLSAELHDRLREPAARRLGEETAGARRPRERHEIDPAVFRERQPRLRAETLEHVQHPRRQPRLEAQPPEPERRQRRVLRRLQDGRVAAEDRRKRLPRDVRQRRVERDQESRDPDGPAKREDGAVRHRSGCRATVRASPLACDEEAHLDRGVRLAERERE